MQRIITNVWLVVGLLLFSLSASVAQANNIRVANVAAGHQDVNRQQTHVAFDLSWENSWRNDINWDAAWVFVKFRAPGSNNWQHAHLSTNSVAHFPAANGVIDAAPDGTGVFIYRDGAYTGAVNYVNTRLLWQYGTNGYAFNRGDPIEISVHAIEMVHVAEGEFYVGSGGTEHSRFFAGATDNEPFLIDAEWSAAVGSTDDARRLGSASNRLWAAGSIGEGWLNDDYPTGYDAFYCMKYSITQGQYADFLNKLTPTQADARFPDAYGNDRFTIWKMDDVYTADTPDRACNWLSWRDGAAYADWAGLRPMTEIEYEKACRGPEYPVPDEYAWGTADRVAQTGHIGIDGSGSEIAEPVGANSHRISQTLVPGGRGPVRVGIYATNQANRVSAGASYWGITELSGNMPERPVTVGNAAGLEFTALHGDGDLTAGGDADVENWPGANAAGAGFRGGSIVAVQPDLRVSHRADAAQTRSPRYYFSGFRAVRTAP